MTRYLDEYRAAYGDDAGGIPEPAERRPRRRAPRPGGQQDGRVAALQDTLRARSEALARVVRERDEARADLEAALEQVDALRGEWDRLTVKEGQLQETVDELLDDRQEHLEVIDTLRDEVATLTRAARRWGR